MFFNMKKSLSKTSFLDFNEILGVILEPRGAPKGGNSLPGFFSVSGESPGSIWMSFWTPFDVILEAFLMFFCNVSGLDGPLQDTSVAQPTRRETKKVT
jgi:hypothetical protein